MSFHEKSAYAMIAILGIVYSGYFLTAWELYKGGATSMWDSGAGMIGAVIGIVILSIVFHIVVAIFTPRDQMENLDQVDERDSSINVRSDARSSWVLAIGTFAAIAMTFSEQSHFAIGHVLLASLVLSEIIKNLSVILQYRMGH